MAKHFDVYLVYRYHVLVDGDSWDPYQDAIDQAVNEHDRKMVQHTLGHPDVATNGNQYGPHRLAVCDCAMPTRKAFKVAAVSSNRNSFGLRSMVVVAQDGEAYRLLSNDLNLKREGGILSVEQSDGRWGFTSLGYEVPERLQPDASADVVKEIWKPREEV